MAKDGDLKPRGRTSAYAYFVQTCRAEHKKKNPNEAVSFGDFSKRCGDRWKTMSLQEKARFNEMADKDKKRHAAEMEHYQPPVNENGRKNKKKQQKDPNAPKRPLSAFLWFSSDERPKAKATMADPTLGNVAKELGRRWAEISDHDKAKYTGLAAKDKARYEKEIEAYKRNGSAGGDAPTGRGKARAAAAKVESSEDEEEEEEEEEEGDEEDEDSDE